MAQCPSLEDHASVLRKLIRGPCYFTCLTNGRLGLLKEVVSVIHSSFADENRVIRINGLTDDCPILLDEVEYVINRTFADKSRVTRINGNRLERRGPCYLTRLTYST